MKMYCTAVDILDSLSLRRISFTKQDSSDYLELQLTCYIALNKTIECTRIVDQLRGKTLTLKQHVLVAKAYLMLNTTRSPSHPAIPHLIAVLQECPYAIELIEKLITLGYPITEIHQSITNPIVKSYIESIQLTRTSQYQASLDVLNSISHSRSTPIPILNQIMINAINKGDWVLFDETTKLIPEHDLSLIDLRAMRLKELQKTRELEYLVMHALNTDQNSAAVWLAMSYYQESEQDIVHSLMATRKALQIDPFFRRAHIRHGELRMKKCDYKKALTAFTTAHTLSPEIDSYKVLVECYYLLGDICSAESLASAALTAYPAGHENHCIAVTLYGIAIQEKDPSLASKFFLKALSLSPNNIDALSSLVDIKAKDSFDEAVALLKEYRTDEFEWFYWLKMAELATMKSDLRMALEYVEKTLELKPRQERALALKEQIELQNATEDDFLDSGDESLEG